MNPFYVPSCLIHGASVICWQEGRFLLVKRKNLPFQEWFSSPGGKVKEGENPYTAAKPEFHEETGLTITRLVHLATLDLAKETGQQKSWFLSVYRALDTSGTAKAGDDAASLHWPSLLEMWQMRVIPSIYEIVEQQMYGKEHAN